jgi:hypothetical protein
VTLSRLDCELHPKVAKIRIFVRNSNSKHFERNRSKQRLEIPVRSLFPLFCAVSFWHITGPFDDWKS